MADVLYGDSILSRARRTRDRILECDATETLEAFLCGLESVRADARELGADLAIREAEWYVDCAAWLGCEPTFSAVYDAAVAREVGGVA